MFFVILFAVYAMIVTAQSYTEKWNSFYKRTEYFDSKGKLQGWKKYNDFYKRMEYFDRNGKMQRYEKTNEYYIRTETKDKNGKIIFSTNARISKIKTAG